MSVSWTDEALRSRDEQLEYIGTDSPAAAERLLGRIERQTLTLAEYPYIGAAYRRGVRICVFARTPFVALYRVDRRRNVQILAFFHGRENWRD